MKQAIRYLFLLPILALLVSCGQKPKVTLTVEESEVQTGDTLHFYIENENIDLLLMDFGDGNDTSINRNIPTEAHFRHAYDTTGTLFPKAFGFQGDDVDSDTEVIEVR